MLAAGRWLLRPLFLIIAEVRSAELFSLAVLLAVLASAWATQAAGLSLALGAFLAGMMLAETEFRHQIEATIRSYREVLLGLFFITVGMLLDVRLLLRTLPLVTALLAGMLVIKAAVVTLVARPATHDWFKSLRTGVVVAQGGEFGFALLTLLLRHDLLSPDARPAAARGHGAEHGALAGFHPSQPADHPPAAARVRAAAFASDARDPAHARGRRARARGDLRLRPGRPEHRARARTDRASSTSRSTSIPTGSAPAGRRAIR